MVGKSYLVPEGLDWATRLPSAAAPGFFYLAGACRGYPVGGGGRDEAEALARLSGETAEVLAQTAVPAACQLGGDPAIDAVWTDATAPLRIAATNIATGRLVGVPAAAVFLSGPASRERRADAPPTSLGLAAGPGPDAAHLAGLLELIERDAAAAWWCGGRQPRQLDAGILAPPAAELARMRQGATGRRPTGFLALASVCDVPVVAAFSRDADGTGLAVGLKAALDPAEASAGALVELLQMELALEMARHRSGRGVVAPGDRGPLVRAALPVDTLDAFAGLPPRLAPAPAAGDFAALAARLAARGVPVTVADFAGSAGGLAVAKVFAPDLRPLPGGTEAPGSGSPGAFAPLM